MSRRPGVSRWACLCALTVALALPVVAHAEGTCTDNIDWMGRPYVDAVIGNGRITAGIGFNGDLVTAFFPHIASYPLVPWWDPEAVNLRAWMELGFGNRGGVESNGTITWFSNAGRITARSYLGDLPADGVHPTGILRYRFAGTGPDAEAFVPSLKGIEVVVQRFVLESGGKFAYRPFMIPNRSPRSVQFLDIPIWFWFLEMVTPTATSEPTGGSLVDLVGKADGQGGQTRIRIAIEIQKAGKQDGMIRFASLSSKAPSLADLAKTLAETLGKDPLNALGGALLQAVLTEANRVLRTTDALVAGDAVVVYVVLGENEKAISDGTTKLLSTTYSALRKDTVDDWQSFLVPFQDRWKDLVRDRPLHARRVERHLRTLRLLADQNGGAISAAPVLIPKYHSTWVRDGVFQSLAWDFAGYAGRGEEDRAGRFYQDWLRRLLAQRSIKLDVLGLLSYWFPCDQSGCRFYQCYDGADFSYQGLPFSIASSGKLALAAPAVHEDQQPIALWGMFEHWRLLVTRGFQAEADSFLKAMMPDAERIARYVKARCESRADGKTNDLPPASFAFLESPPYPQEYVAEVGAELFAAVAEAKIDKPSLGDIVSGKFRLETVLDLSDQRKESLRKKLLEGTNQSLWTAASTVTGLESWIALCLASRPANPGHCLQYRWTSLNAFADLHSVFAKDVANGFLTAIDSEGVPWDRKLGDMPATMPVYLWPFGMYSRGNLKDEPAFATLCAKHLSSLATRIRNVVFVPSKDSAGTCVWAPQVLAQDGAVQAFGDILGNSGVAALGGIDLVDKAYANDIYIPETFAMDAQGSFTRRGAARPLGWAHAFAVLVDLGYTPESREPWQEHLEWPSMAGSGADLAEAVRLAGMHDFAGALAALEQPTALSWPATPALRSRILKRLNRATEALEAARMAVERSPGSESELLLAAALADAGRFEEAVEAVRAQCTDRQGTREPCVEAFDRVSASLADAGRFEQAALLLDLAPLRFRGDPWLVHRLERALCFQAVAAHQAGDPAISKRSLTRALQVDPRNTFARKLWMAYGLQGP